MVFTATLNNISAISWRSVLLVGETGGPGKEHRPVDDVGIVPTVWYLLFLVRSVYTIHVYMNMIQYNYDRYFLILFSLQTIKMNAPDACM